MKTILPPVLFEDDTLIAFDKPSGLLVAPDRWDKERENLMTVVHQRLNPEWFNVHRLDHDASGVLLCAKGKDAVRYMCRVFNAGSITKDYIAIVQGGPIEASGSIQLRLEPDFVLPGRMRVARDGGGKAAETRYEVAERWSGHSLLRLRLLTSRTHQIRVHLAASGWPVVADPFYGGSPLRLSRLKPGYKFKEGKPEKPLMGRLALHAQRLRLAHPKTGELLTIESPEPKDFRISIRYLRQWAAA